MAKNSFVPCHTKEIAKRLKTRKNEKNLKIFQYSFQKTFFLPKAVRVCKKTFFAVADIVTEFVAKMYVTLVIYSHARPFAQFGSVDIELTDPPT